MLDPLILRIISFAFALLFLSAAAHKISTKLQFRGIIEAYQVLPNGLVPLVAGAIPLFEVFLGLAWLSTVVQSWSGIIVPLATAMLLTAYGMVIGINLVRGRTYIDCGCGFSSAAGNNKGGGDIQQLSGGLIVRNLALILAALITTLPSSERLLGIIDYFSAFSALVALVLLYGASHQLMLNQNAIGAWRNSS